MAEPIVMSEMTWTEVDEALKERPVALVPVGSIQAHGPHLPLSTDTVIAMEMARRGAKKLKAHGVNALILPPVTFGVAEWGAGFAGTLNLPAETTQALLRDVCLAAAKRFRCVGLATVHLEPPQLESLRKAVEDTNKTGASVCWADLTKKRWAQLLGPRFADGDHAGQWETAVMMSAAPDLVRERERARLTPLEGLAAGLKKGAKTFEEAGGEDAFFGDPTVAMAEDGNKALEALGEILSVSVMEQLGSKR